MVKGIWLAEMERKMNRQKPVAGEFYRHFKGNIYQIKMLAKDSESAKEKVVYQAMYAPFTCWVRDLEEFLSQVDREKYPDEVQKYRFEKVVLEEENSLQKKSGWSTLTDGDTSEQKVSLAGTQGAGQAVEINSGKESDVSDEELVKALKTGQPERYLEQKMTEDEIANRGLLQLLDAETFREKRQIFIGLKQYLNERMLNNIAVALDIVLEEGDVETQYESIMHCLDAFEHYEGGRLR